MANVNKDLNNYYVVSALVSAEVHRTLQDSRLINLIASNAQAASLRAGEQAAGFRALTKSIDELAGYTTAASKKINLLAVKTNKIAAHTARSEAAISRFNQVQDKASSAQYRETLNTAVTRTHDKYEQAKRDLTNQITEMCSCLEDLDRELRTATVLASIARVEASRINDDNQDTFQMVANTVDKAANQIKKRVRYSLGLLNDVNQ
jgi:hypothetical protein